MTCSDCRFWKEDPKATPSSPPTGHGRCHRYAPRPADLLGKPMSHRSFEWPLTMKDDFCGEWEVSAEVPTAPVRAMHAPFAAPNTPTPARP